MRGTYITASVIALLIVLWLLSGQLGQPRPSEPPSLAQANQERAAQVEDTVATRVRARVMQASPQVRQVVLRGRTENKRTVQVKAETTGRVIERPVDRGSEVAAGDLLCRLNLEDRQVGLAEARAALEQAEIEYQASLRLREKGFQSETAIAQAKARRAAAEAQVERRELDLARTEVRAPFAGMVEEVHLEVGDYVTPGNGCVTMVDMNPMLLVGRVSETQVANLEEGQTITGKLSDGRTVQGPITFIGQQADAQTRTYAVQAEVANPDYALRSGITTRLHIPVDEVLAHRISPALFTLDDEGRVGVRVINDRNRVEFHHIDIVREEPGGAWVTGLPEVTTLITVGQELVVAGQRVAPVFEGNPEMPAKTNDEAAPSSSRAAGPDAGRGRTADPAATVAAKP